MKEITANLNSYRQSPRKVRLVADAIRGKKVSVAKTTLDFLIKRSAGPLQTLLNSAIANAKNQGVAENDLFVKKITVDQGAILYRRMPVAHGSSNPIRKRTSHVKIVLTERKSEAKNHKSETKKSNLKSKN